MKPSDGSGNPNSLNTNNTANALGGKVTSPNQLGNLRPGGGVNQAPNSFRATNQLGRPSPMKGAGLMAGQGGAMNNRQMGLGVSSAGAQGAPGVVTNSILGGVGGPPTNNNPQGNNSMIRMSPGVGVMGAASQSTAGGNSLVGGSSAATGITGLSHPSTAAHTNATHEHLNSTVGSHARGAEGSVGVN